MATVIVSDETIKNLLEAHASMAAWYYQMAAALREAGVTAEEPSEEQRKAYIAQIGQHYAELGAVAATITTPRAYIPPPAVPAPATVVENEGITVAEPPKDHVASPEFVPGPEPAPAPAPAPVEPGSLPTSDGSGAPPPPPPMVDPSKVKYDE